MRSHDTRLSDLEEILDQLPELAPAPEPGELDWTRQPERLTGDELSELAAIYERTEGAHMAFAAAGCDMNALAQLWPTPFECWRWAILVAKCYRPPRRYKTTEEPWGEQTGDQVERVARAITGLFIGGDVHLNPYRFLATADRPEGSCLPDEELSPWDRPCALTRFQVDWDIARAHLLEVCGCDCEGVR